MRNMDESVLWIYPEPIMYNYKNQANKNRDHISFGRNVCICNGPYILIANL